jgi:hypothetical protein
MKIGLDFDGVISDCGALKRVAAKKMFGVDIPVANFKKEIVVGGGLLTMTQYRALQDEIYGTYELGMTAEPVPGALAAIPRLRADGHDILVVTSRTGTMLDIARAWTKKCGLTLDFVGVGHDVGHDKSKAAAAAKLDFFVDDDLDKLEPLVDVVPHRFLFSWPYNAAADVGDIATRVSSWEELLTRVAALEKMRTRP